VGWNGTSLEVGLTTKLFNVVVFGQIGNMLLVDSRCYALLFYYVHFHMLYLNDYLLSFSRLIRLVRASVSNTNPKVIECDTSRAILELHSVDAKKKDEHNK
jgi:hypothetical protein